MSRGPDTEIPVPQGCKGTQQRDSKWPTGLRLPRDMPGGGHLEALGDLEVSGTEMPLVRVLCHGAYIKNENRKEKRKRACFAEDSRQGPAA